jgi:hypothetical protein
MKKATLIIFSFILLASSLAACSIKSTNVKQGIKTVSSSSALATIGNPCTPAGEDVSNSDGLECYCYDGKKSADAQPYDRPPRLCSWFKPDIEGWPVGYTAAAYDEYFKISNKYQSPDKIFSFSYPKNFKVEESNWQEGQEVDELTKDSVDAFPRTQFFEVENNAITMQQRISYDTKDKTYSENDINLNGSDGIQLNIAPINNLMDTQYFTELFFQKDKYYIEVNTIMTGNALLDLPTEFMLSTLKIK